MKYKVIVFDNFHINSNGIKHFMDKDFGNIVSYEDEDGEWCAGVLFEDKYIYKTKECDLFCSAQNVGEYLKGAIGVFDLEIDLYFTKEEDTFLNLKFNSMFEQVCDNHKGYLYLLECKNIYKIGITKCWNNRKTAYKTENPFPINVIFCEEIYGNDKIEKLLQTFFKNKHHRGEWFSLNHKDVQNIKKVLYEIYEKDLYSSSIFSRDICNDYHNKRYIKNRYLNKYYKKLTNKK